MNQRFRSTARPWQVACLIAASLAAPVFAQTAVPLANPDLHLAVGGTVRTMARLTDGSVVFSGSFTSVGGVAHNGFAKLLPDGTLDTNWNPSACFGGPPDTFAASSDGGLFVACNFTVLKFSGSGTVDPDWHPTVDSVRKLAVDGTGNVYIAGYDYLKKVSGSGTGTLQWSKYMDAPATGLAVDSDGNVYVSGNFTRVGSDIRNGLAKITSAGTVLGWNPGPDGSVSSFAFDAANNVYAAGRFSSIGGQARNGVAKLSGSGAGAADPNWNPAPDSTFFTSVITGASGDVYVAGTFTTIGGQSRKSVAKLSATTGAADPSWNAVVNDDVYQVLLTGAGNIYLGGHFTSVGTQPRLALAVVAESNAAAAGGINVELPARVVALAKQPGGGMIVGGVFDLAGGLSRVNLLRLQPDGTLDPLWNPGMNREGLVKAIVTNNNGDVFVGGGFWFMGGQVRLGLAKLSGGGTGAADIAWGIPSATTNYVDAMAIDTAGHLYVAGPFSSIGGQTRRFLAKLSDSGSGQVDPLWNPSPDQGVLSLATNAAGDVFVVGWFTSIGGGANRKYIAKLSGTGTGTGAADPTWAPWADSRVGALAVDAAGNVHVGGLFSIMGGELRNRIARMPSVGTGAADLNWDPSADGEVRHIDFDAMGNVYTSGAFSNIGGNSRSGIAMLAGGSTGAATAWSVTAAVGSVETLTVATNGIVYVGGTFTSIGGQPRSGLAAFGGDRLFANGLEN